MLFFEILSSLSLWPFAKATAQTCKAVPGTALWPSAAAWTSLNRTLSGALIKSIPPGGVCHPGWPNYNRNSSCAEVQKLWLTSWAFHSDDPVGNGYNNWNNDSCLPSPLVPCTDLGYPVYVVNATKSEHVQAGVNFARDHNVRLIVKTSGHDFRGRSVAPYSLSIWTHNLLGLSYHAKFEPSGGRCDCGDNWLSAYNGPAIKMAAGENHGAAFDFANKHGLMIHVAGARTVGLGGYITGGGHSLISFQKGLAADSILELTVVLPSGDIVTANACKNPDLFWALRGGGGSTVGVVLDFTTRAWQSESVADYAFGFGSPTFNDDRFWEAMGYMAGLFPSLIEAGIMTYSNIYPANGTTSPTLLNANMQAPNMSAARMGAILEPIAKYINATFAPDVIAEIFPGGEKASYYEWWQANQDTTTPVGVDAVISSRLLDAKALKSPQFKTLARKAMGGGGIQINVVGGPGTHAFPSDWNAVTPAWRTSYAHTLTGVYVPPYDPAEDAAQIFNITYNLSAALRELAPDTGSYLNEANSYEPDFQDAFWGSNYPRLLEIKRKVDPGDVFWCLGCAGSERWQAIGEKLCRV
ncbi:FAD-binding domain-containing protein [Rhizodiscina lignyota]|uniref:FAD-binding domain-containing protein n=1 Tax=Rhizodiscina lignyota TaxID=1504668 RepID=A0A9P4M4Z2_9PEZI|nr:FAD-binding domain-containing protein [Rhizodiscina lignyota]